jgi:hypothetical protein
VDIQATVDRLVTIAPALIRRASPADPMAVSKKKLAQMSRFSQVLGGQLERLPLQHHHLAKK